VKVGVFYNSIRNSAKFSNKTRLMDVFAQGVGVAGDIPVTIKMPREIVTNIDAAFVLGYTLEKNFRRQIIDTMSRQQIPTVFVDSNILHYARSEHEWHRYSLNGVYPTSGTYFFSDLDRNKWDQYSSWHGAALQPWRINGDHILIFCQRPQGWNLFGNDQIQWLNTTINNIRAYSSRPIRIRLHPGDGKKTETVTYLRSKYGTSIDVSTADRIRDDLSNCWCAVGYNSTPNVVAAIEGIPVCLSDSANSWARDVAFTDISQIDDPPLPDRSEWLHKIANIHWSSQEVAKGKLWSAIRSYIEQPR
jgi:hypothetical protein